MIIVISMIIAIIILVCVEIKEWGISWRIFEGIGLGFLVGLLCGFLLLLFGNAFCSCITEKDMVIDTIETTELIALKDNYTLEGEAFLFSSTINEDLTYTYLYNIPNKGITTESIKATNAYLNYISENEKPYIQKITEIPRSKILYYLFLCDNTYYSIYLPQGSIIENVYEINLE